MKKFVGAHPQILSTGLYWRKHRKATNQNTSDVIIAVRHEGTMPPKVRELKAALAKAGFVRRPAKGSHLHWVHPDIPGTDVTIAGHDGDDAHHYQIKQVQAALKKVGGKL